MTLVFMLLLIGCGSGSQAHMPDTSGAGVIPLASAVEPSPTFNDIPANAAYAEAVSWCYENGLMNGISTTAFDPEGTLTRSMLATVLYRTEKEPAVTAEPSFTDTEAGTWYSNAVVWSNAQGIIRGYGNGLFGTNDPVSVEQLEVIMGRYTGHGPEWTGDPTRAHAATRAQVAVALYTNLSNKADDEISSLGKSIVYMTTDISSDGLMEIYEALEASPEGKVAVKLSTGEPGSNYLRTDLIGELVQSLNATIVECNTAYGGSRSNTAMHKQVAADHGYTDIAMVDIMDEEGELSLPVTKGDKELFKNNLCNIGKSDILEV